MGATAAPSVCAANSPTIISGELWATKATTSPRFTPSEASPAATARRRASSADQVRSCQRPEGPRYRIAGRGGSARPRPAPVLHPQTRNPVGPQDLAPLFPMAIIEQEMSTRREVPIPDEVRAALALWRPSPLFRAERLERAVGTRSHIYYKYEGVSPSGSHKPNTAVAQAFYNAK